MFEEKEKTGTSEEDLKFFEDLFEEDDSEEDEESSKKVKDEKGEKGEGESGTDEQAEEEQRRKNKDAEEARKRREKEAKEKKEESKVDPKADKVNKLGEQLVDFKEKYPDVDLVELDKDENFKRYIDGKILGKKHFSKLYEEYLGFKSSLSGKSEEELKLNYQRKKESSTGSQKSKEIVPDDVYSETELEKISSKLPYMTRQQARAVEEKINKSIKFYEKK